MAEVAAAVITVAAAELPFGLIVVLAEAVVPHG